jgi:hypothetical protein
MENELESMCKEAVVAYFLVLSSNMPGGTEGKRGFMVYLTTFSVADTIWRLMLD